MRLIADAFPISMMFSFSHEPDRPRHRQIPTASRDMFGTGKSAGRRQIFWVSFFTISTFWEPRMMRRSANDKAILFNARAFDPHETGMVEHGDTEATEGRFFGCQFSFFSFFGNREARVA
jgi:hypothetical protein